MIKLAPSILSADFGNLAQELRRIDQAGCEYVHIDVMDGRFVPNITLGPPVIQSLRSKSLRTFDVHLMIEEPQAHLEAFARAGADILTVHQEVCPHLQKTLAQIKQLGKKAGVSLNPSTSEETLRYVLDDIDMILVMTVNPGFGGQSFLPAMLPKIQAVRRMIQDRPIEIQVDGGITPHNASEVIRQGATVLVAGSALFGAPDLSNAVQSFRQAAAQTVPQA